MYLKIVIFPNLTMREEATPSNDQIDSCVYIPSPTPLLYLDLLSPLTIKAYPLPSYIGNDKKWW